MAEVQTNVAEVQTNVEQVTAQVEGVQASVDAVDERFEQVDGRVTQAHQRVDSLHEEFNSQIAAIETQQATASSAIAQEELTALDGRIGRSQATADAAAQRIVATEAQVESLASELDETKQQLASTSQQLNETQQQLANATQELTNSSTSDSATLNGRVDDIESRINARLDHIETSTDSDERIAALNASVAHAEQVAREAHEYSDTLRLLQTEIVTTMQSEMQGQAEELRQHSAALVELGNTEEYAPAERVHQLETKIVEALQTISQLTQLQRRNTTIETQLTDTLTATSEGVEHTQHHVMALRNELEQAFGRIAQLEAEVSGGAAPVAAVQPAQQLAVVPAAPEAHEAVAETLSEEEDAADTDWFNESLARKNAG